MRGRDQRACIKRLFADDGRSQRPAAVYRIDAVARFQRDTAAQRDKPGGSRHDLGGSGRFPLGFSAVEKGFISLAVVVHLCNRRTVHRFVTIFSLYQQRSS